MQKTDRTQMNQQLLEHLSVFLNENSSAIDARMIRRLQAEVPLTEEEAYRYLLAGCLDLDAAGADRQLFQLYFPAMVHRLSAADYCRNAYLQTVHLSPAALGSWTIEQRCYQPYEAFVMDDFQSFSDGRTVPQIGYFPEQYSYPCVLQDHREWMMITPNEINTMQPVIQEASGAVLTYGLGLGYFAFCASEKPQVQSVTVVEKDPEVIRLFQQAILPQFPQRNKIQLIQADACVFARENRKPYDLTFADLWHDVSDGIPMYRRLKPYEHGKTRYWIYPTMRYYLDLSESTDCRFQ